MAEYNPPSVSEEYTLRARNQRNHRCNRFNLGRI